MTPDRKSQLIGNLVNAMKPVPNPDYSHSEQNAKHAVNQGVNPVGAKVICRLTAKALRRGWV
jgi:hypothetical protein